MVQSLNKKSELVMNATSHMGLTDYGKIMIGDRAFEFYDDRDKKNYIQIPWTEIDYVVVSVMFGGKWIPRFGIKTKKNGLFTFSSKDPKRVLRQIREHIDANNIVKSLSFFQVLGRGVKGLLHRNKK